MPVAILDRVNSIVFSKNAERFITHRKILLLLINMALRLKLFL